MNAPASPRDVGASVAAKVNRRILPLLMAGWFIAYIDRFNVSFAALQMNEEIGLSQAMFGLGAGLFFVGYAIFEIPSNLLLTRVGPRRWLGRIMISWGVISVAMMWIENPATFYVLRFLLGVAEAGCFPGMAFYLTRWLGRRERAAALASLATMSMASGVAGAPLAAGLLALDGVGGASGWQWLFLIEGIPAILIGGLISRYLPEDPDTVSWLTGSERAWIASHRVAESDTSPRGSALWTVLGDRRYWLWGAAFFFSVASGSALRLFQPTILQQTTGLGDVLAVLLTAVPSIVGVVAIVWVGRRSTRHDERRLHAGVPTLVAAAGLALVGITYGLGGALLVASIATLGVAAQPPLFAAVSSAATGSVNAVGIAFVNSVSSLGAFVGPFIVGFGLDRTGSLALVCGLAALGMAVGGLLMLVTPERLHGAETGPGPAWRVHT